MSSKAGGSQGGWQVKRINSVTGPLNGTNMTEAIEKWNTNVTGQVTIIWHGNDSTGGLASKCKFYNFI